jgi:hypothetical protein
MTTATTVSVWDYFRKSFGLPPDDDTLLSLPINSPCGRECQDLIEKAVQDLIDKAVDDLAADPDPDFRALLLQRLNQDIEIKWRG